MPAPLGPVAPRVGRVKRVPLPADMIEVERAHDHPATHVAHHVALVDQAGPVAA
jgi:hypothetical protein